MTETLTLTVKQFAEMMQISLPTAYNMIRRPGFPLVTEGRKLLILKSALQSWLEAQVRDGS